MHQLYFVPLFLLLVASVSGCFSSNIISNAGHEINTLDNRVSSWKELNEKSIIMQKYDYSCGAASLATLMRYYFQDDITEKKILNHIEKTFTKEELNVVVKKGLSFLEMEKISQSLGYQSAGVRLKLPALRELSGPVIVYINRDNYKHFAVLRGIRGDRVLLADPSRGNLILSINEFLQEWKGETFVLGKEGFGLPKRHPLAILLASDFRSEVELLRTPLLTLPKTRIKTEIR